MVCFECLCCFTFDSSIKRLLGEIVWVFVVFVFLSKCWCLFRNQFYFVLPHSTRINVPTYKKQNKTSFMCKDNIIVSHELCKEQQ